MMSINVYTVNIITNMYKYIITISRKLIMKKILLALSLIALTLHCKCSNSLFKMVMQFKEKYLLLKPQRNTHQSKVVTKIALSKSRLQDLHLNQALKNVLFIRKIRNLEQPKLVSCFWH